MNLPICFYCKYKEKGRLKCKAFENELIPDEILMGKFTHVVPFPGQKNNIIFASEAMFEEAKQR